MIEQYVYYHRTGNKGKSPEKWVREEKITRQLSQAIGVIKMDADVEKKIRHFSGEKWRFCYMASPGGRTSKPIF